MAAHPELARRIQPHAAEIARLACDAMRADPFSSPFPALGQHASPQRVAEDVDALVRTLESGDSARMLAYVRRLRTAWVDAGLTTRHLVANFRRLHDAILAGGLSEAGAARTMLDRAVLALRYDGTTAAAVQDASRQLAEDAVVTLHGVHLGEEAAEAQWIEALELLVSYLADSMAARRPDLLAAYLRRIAGSGMSVVRPAEPSAMLAALNGALDELPDSAHRDASDALASARSSLASPMA